MMQLGGRTTMLISIKRNERENANYKNSKLLESVLKYIEYKPGTAYCYNNW